MDTLQFSKDVLFYSNLCLFSKKLLVTINKLGIKEMFIYVCVENYRTHIPNIIDRVPTILTTRGKIIIEDQITPYIESVADNNDTDSNGVIEVFSHTNAGYSYLNEDVQEQTGNSEYGIFGHEQRIDTPNDDDDYNDSAADYEKYKSGRDSEISVMHKQQTDKT
jgi:hypothetical protein